MKNQEIYYAKQVMRNYKTMLAGDFKKIVAPQLSYMEYMEKIEKPLQKRTRNWNGLKTRKCNPADFSKPGQLTCVYL